KVHLLTFEPRLQYEWNEDEVTRQREQLSTQGIYWSCLPYHKSPSVPATAYDILAGARFAVQLVRREGLDVLHARAHVPMAMALLARRFVRCRLVFDFRGLMADEYADAGVWTEQSPIFRAVKMIERAGFRRANQVIVLTQRMRDWLIHRQLKKADQIEVIPCCVDRARFERSRGDPIEITAQSVAADRFEVVYAGSLIGLYLVEEMGRFFTALKALRPDAFLRILSVTPSAPGAAALKRAGLNENDFKISSAAPGDVSAILKRARLGISFRKSAFSQIAASPTKIPEYLAAGLPIVSNQGIGDIDELLMSERVGVGVTDFDSESLANAVASALALAAEPGIAERCREVAQRRFDLDTVGGARYLT
ncbi:MAG: glycosyltransferase, partial [Burkholderiales bacterium]